MSETRSDRVSPLQVKDQVYERLRSALVAGEFVPGEPLREAALTQKYGVSKTPIREALVRLHQDGLVEIEAYRGARASTYTPEFLSKVHEAREILESECARRAAVNDGPGTAQKLRKTILQAQKALEKGRIFVAAESLDQFDEVLFDHLQNPLLDEVKQRLNTHLRRAARANLTAEAIAESLLQHGRIADAIESGDPVLADRELKDHLRHIRANQIDTLEDVRQIPS